MLERKSKQRDGILEILSQKDYHPSAEEIYDRMKADFPRLGIATVYRNLEQLTRAGRILKIDVSGEPARYEGNLERHYHARCTECGLVKDVWLGVDIRERTDFNGLIPDFKVTDYRIDFLGICGNCEKK